jgi:general secretion pathway protein B
MSYILEALKKAQAERQVGSTPTIHASPLIHAAPAGPAASGKPLLIGLGAGALVVALAAVVAWRHQGGVPASPPVVVAASTPTAPPTAPAVVPEPARLPAPAAIPKAVARPTPAAIPEPAPRPAPAPRVKTAVAKPVPPPLPEPAVQPERAVPRPVSPAVHEPAMTRAPSQPAVPAAATGQQPEAEPVAYAAVRSLQTLPEVIQREVPKVAFGGYIYSQNAEDRLLLVDKILRREGEEVAPGLMLERLLPKAAIMNYRGYRYRVPY